MWFLAGVVTGGVLMVALQAWIGCLNDGRSVARALRWLDSMSPIYREALRQSYYRESGLPITPEGADRIAQTIDHIRGAR